jgi:sugar lactone lactonase YvrE
VAVDQRGEIYVVDQGNRRIQIFSMDGRFLRQFSGDGTGRLQHPDSCTVFGDLVVVSDWGDDSIKLFNRSGSLLRVLGGFGDAPGKLNEPRGVAVDSQANIYTADSNNNRVVKFGRDGRFLKQWGEFGALSGQMAQPTGIAVRGQELFVADLINHRVQVFDLNGSYRFQFGRHPVDGHEGDGRTHYPYRVALARHSPYFAIVEPNENRVQVFSSRSFENLQNVDDVAWWNKGSKFHYGARATMMKISGHIGISEPDTHSVLVFRREPGNPRPQFATLLGGRGSRPGEFIQPSGLATDGESRLYVSDSGNRRLQTFELQTAGGNVQRFGAPASELSGLVPNSAALREIVELVADQFQQQVRRFSAPNLTSAIVPSGMRMGPDRNLYVIDPYNSRIIVFNSNYEIQRVIGGDKSVLHFPLDLDFNQSGTSMFVVDAYGARVVKFNLANGMVEATIGQHLSQVSDQPNAIGFVNPFGIASGIDGHLYVTDVGQHLVYKIREDGTLVATWGGWGTGPVQFYKPKGVAQSRENELVVVDFGNHRAQVINTNGEFIAEFGISNSAVMSTRP